MRVNCPTCPDNSTTSGSIEPGPFDCESIAEFSRANNQAAVFPQKIHPPVRVVPSV